MLLASVWMPAGRNGLRILLSHRHWEDLTEPEIEYDAGPNADAWGRAGFSVITIAEECRMSAMEIEVPVGNPEGDNTDEV